MTDSGCPAGEGARRPSEGGGVGGQPAGAHAEARARVRPAECRAQGGDEVSG